MIWSAFQDVLVRSYRILELSHLNIGVPNVFGNFKTHLF